LKKSLLGRVLVMKPDSLRRFYCLSAKEKILMGTGVKVLSSDRASEGIG
jgi:hypothetical protein